MNEAVVAVLPQMPFAVGAYGLIWIVLFGFMVFVYVRLSRIEKQISIIETTVKRRDKLDAADAAEAADKAAAAKPAS
jgi:CcmD family protein